MTAAADSLYQQVSAGYVPLSEICENDATEPKTEAIPLFTDSGDETIDIPRIEYFPDGDDTLERQPVFYDPQSRLRNSPWLLYLFSILQSCALILIPSFITDRWKDKPSTPAKIPATAYLNGVRGVAAYCVWCQHFINEYYGAGLFNAYGTLPQDVYIIQLPLIRLFYSGGFMVPVFFVLSGFVLSIKPLRLARAKDRVALNKSLASSVFRRGPRLFLPIIPPMFVVALLVYYGYFSVSTHPFDQTYVVTAHSSVFGELGEALWNFETLASPIRGDKRFFVNYNAPLWTLPYEFHGSFVVFIMALAFSEAKPYMRISTSVLLAWYCIWRARWDVFLFIGGMVFAELRLIREEMPFALSDLAKTPKAKKILKATSISFWVTVLICSLWLGSWPHEHGSEGPGFRTLAALTPALNSGSEGAIVYFWASIGAVGLIASLENLPILQVPFNTSFIRYIGDVSFSMYILHSPMICTLGRPITTRIVGMIGSLDWGVFISGVLLTPILICLADVQWRLFDEGAVKFVRWVETKFFR